MKLNDRIVGATLLGFSGAVWWVAKSYPLGSKILPLSIASLVGILAISLILKKQQSVNSIQIRKIMPYLLILLATIVVMNITGFFLALLFLVVGGMVVQQQLNLKKIIVTSCIFCLISYLLFIQFLELPLPMVWK